MKITVLPTFGAEPLMCSSNVEEKIKATGGEAVYGYKIEDKGPEIIVKSPHCVWKDNDGQLWDVTPEFGEYAFLAYWNEETEFEPCADVELFTKGNKVVGSIARPMKINDSGVSG